MREQILLVDDNSDIRKILSILLERAGYDVKEAESGEEAIAIASEKFCDLILLDLNMPGMSGFEVCEKLKADKRTKSLPIIFLSSSVDSSDKINAFDLGAVDYLTKTLNKGELLARVRTQLKLASTLKALEQANHLLAHKQQELQDDLHAAARIQETLLPKSIRVCPEIEVEWRFLPSQIVAGDLFNMVQLDTEYVAIYILDVSGHGVPSAMVAVSLSQTLHGSNNAMLLERNNPKSPGKVLSTLNHLYPIERFGKYFTMIYMLLNLRTGELCYSSAGHPPPILIRSDGAISSLLKGGTITGFDELTPFEEESVFLKPHDRIILYTDGLTDHIASNSLTTIISSLSENHNKGLPIVIDKLVSEMLSGISLDHLEDDVSIFAFEYNPIKGRD